MGKKIHDEQSVTGFYFASASGVVSRAIITDSVFIKIFAHHGFSALILSFRIIALKYYSS